MFQQTLQKYKLAKCTRFVKLDPIIPGLPDCSKMKISVTGYEGKERIYVKDMIRVIGAVYTGELSQVNSPALSSRDPIIVLYNATSFFVAQVRGGGGGKTLTMTMTPWNLPHGQWSKKLTMTMTPSILSMVNGQNRPILTI